MCQRLSWCSTAAASTQCYGGWIARTKWEFKLKIHKCPASVFGDRGQSQHWYRSNTTSRGHVWNKQPEQHLAGWGESGCSAQRVVSGVVWLNQNKHLVAVIPVKLMTFGPPALQHWQVDSFHLSQSNAVSLSTRGQRPCQQHHNQQSADPSRAEHKTSNCQRCNPITLFK